MGCLKPVEHLTSRVWYSREAARRTQLEMDGVMSSMDSLLLG